MIIVLSYLYYSTVYNVIVFGEKTKDETAATQSELRVLSVSDNCADLFDARLTGVPKIVMKRILDGLS